MPFLGFPMKKRRFLISGMECEYFLTWWERGAEGA
jgi:hypothetical protein